MSPCILFLPCYIVSCSSQGCHIRWQSKDAVHCRTEHTFPSLHGSLVSPCILVGHISLSFVPGDTPKLSDKLMADIAKEYLRRMGVVNTQYIISRHHDKPHPHVHIVYNRVNNDGSSISGDQNFRKSARITQDGDNSPVQ